MLFECREPSRVSEHRLILSPNPNSLHDAPHALLPRLFLKERVLPNAKADASESNTAASAPATHTFLI